MRKLLRKMRSRIKLFDVKPTSFFKSSLVGMNLSLHEPHNRLWMGRLAPIFISSTLMVISPSVFAQSSSIRGKVTTSEGPLERVSVTVDGQREAVFTNANGEFVLRNTNAKLLTFSHIGYKTVSVELTSQMLGADNTYVVNVTLEPSDESVLDEVVVVGFGTQKKVNLTGAVGTISAKELEARPVQNVSQMLQGVLPGLNVSTQGVGGSLNAGRSVNVRGTGTISTSSSGSPLVLIDGTAGSLDALNPQDIESISVLKDAASAAVYGSRAPFGVILVTTKKGTSGKTRINYNNNFRWNSPVLLADMMNSYEFANYWNDADYNGGGSGQKFNASMLQKIKDYIDGKLEPNDVAAVRGDGKWDYDNTWANVDWVREYFRDSAPTNEHNLSLSGGANQWTYYLSGNYMDQEGLLRYGTDTYKRYTASGRISGKVFDNLRIEYLNRFVRTNYGRPTSMPDDFYDNVLRRARPNRAKYDPNGFLMADINYINAFENGGRRNDEQDFQTQQFQAIYNPINDLEITGELNYRTETQFIHEDAFKTYAYNGDGVQRYISLLSPANDYVYEYAKKMYFFNPNVYANYKKSFNNHNIAAMVGFQSEWNKYRDLDASRRNLITTSLPVLNLTTDATPTISGQVQEWATAGFFGRFNYDYKGKYLLEGNLRYDGTSRFRSDKQWNWFPSLSAGWNIAQEDFFQSISAVNMLKLRASYGILGNQNTNDWYPTYQVMSSLGTSNGGWLVDGSRPNTVSAPGLISTALTWEQIRNWNYGLDWALLGNRLTGSFDYYLRYTDNGVGPGLVLPATLGTAVPRTNNIDIVTKGFEFSLGWNDQKGDFGYSAKVNLSDNRTKVLAYNNPTNSLDTYIAGQYTNQIWGYTTIGIAKTNEEMNEHLAKLGNGGQNPISGGAWEAGDIMYADLNGDGKIDGGANTLDNPGDRTIIGNSTPRYALGLDLSANYKGFDVRAFFQGILKRDWAPSGMVFWGTTSSGEWWSTALKDHLDYFRADESHPLGQNLDAYYPRPLFSGKNQQAQTGYLLNASYIRLKNVQVGYTFSSSMLQSIRMNNARIFFSGENLATFTKLSKTLDPESIGIGRQGGTVYPLSKILSFGISANF
ncbi:MULTISPECIES: SusC/RagA family TonB-linked outer membrane protein [Sphingobacterium]|nr:MULTISPECIES: TonB-dependent receptor [Sphingobacterium]